MSVFDSNRRLRALLAAALLGIATVALSGCEDEGPMEEAGERLDDAADEARDAAEDAEEEVRDAIEDAQN